MDHLLRTIKRAFPDIEWTTARENDSGWDHHVIILDDRDVFRLPKAAVEPGYFEREIALLQLLSQRTAVATPRITHVSDDQKIMGYAYLPGQPLEAAVVDELPVVLMQAVAEQLSTLLGDVHAVPLAACAHLDLIVRRAKDAVDWLQAGFDAHLRSVLGSRECAAIIDYLPELDRMSDCPHNVLVHGDLELDGVILDREPQQIAVIDWTNSACGDPALDFSGLLAETPALAAVVLDRYTHAARYGDLLGRARVYIKMIAVGLMIHSFLGKHDLNFDELRNRFRERFDL